MSKRFESGASKRKRKRLENDMVKKLRPINAFLDQPLTEAASASGEADTLILTQGNQCGGAIQPTTSIQPEEKLPETETAKQDVEQQAEYEKTAMMPAQNENIELIQESLNGQGEAKERQENNVDSQNFQLTPDKIGQVQGIPDSDIDDAKHRSTVTDVGLWTELSHEDVSYWVERGPSQVQHRCGPLSNSKRVSKKQSRFCTKALFYSTKVNGETYSREWLVYSPSKGRIYCFVCKLFPNIASSATSLASEGFDNWQNPRLIQTHENSEKHRNAMLTYLTRKRGQTLTSTWGWRIGWGLTSGKA
ncbi:zinc finger MYM-type protein 5-like [Amblyraja radiata]|uniref:zinc finger MYM-type protein 5-like n=1 Tax=Amblyraja radiata TaxID=386614 RepID=UPI001403FA02|nr:zinc finger MYM-type protein 5-like [Amblyraja radiata]